jgi:DMSO/TMAO reductase YedYZ molybdopterin-dependent catalytic subunit
VTIPRPATANPAPAAQPFSVSGLSPYVTPNDDFYRIDTALIVPQIEVADWSLRLTGLVDREFTIDYDELLSLDAIEETVTLQCVSNEVGGSLVGNSVWQGVPLEVLLERAGVRDGATQIVGRSLDDWTAGFPTELARDGRVAMVAYAMNGEPLPVTHGFPARLIVAGLYGYVSATKWLREIELTTWEDFDGYWITRGWGKEGPIKTASRIDVPRRSTSIPAGPTAVAGVAWAPPRGVARVELQVDDQEWQECRLGDVASDNTWVQWLYEWDADPGDHVLTVRATDGTRATQTSEIQPPIPDGATGWHSRRVTVDGST